MTTTLPSLVNVDYVSEIREGRIEMEGERYVGWRDGVEAVGSLLLSLLLAELSAWLQPQCQHT